MVIGSNLFNFAQFAYHFITARFLEKVYGQVLGKIYYGDVAAVISLLGLITIAQLAFSLTVVKFIASEKSRAAVANLAKWVNGWSLWFGFLIGVSILLISPWLVGFLNIQDTVSIYLVGPIVLFFILITTHRAILQGTLSFNRYVLSLLIEALVKIILVMALVLIGFATFGAITAILVGSFVAFIFTRVSLSQYLKGKKREKPKIKPLLAYSFPVLVQGLALTSMYTSDLLLVKHFFSPEVAGGYASLAILGRIAFFGASPVIHVMFPLVARRYSHGQPYHKIFYLSILLVTLITSLVVLVYKLLPEIPIRILFGEGYLDGAPILWWFGIFMMLLVLNMLFTQFYLSVGKTRVVWLFVLAAILQTVLIWLVHPSIERVIQISILSAALLVISLIVYFPWHDRKKA